MPSTNDYLFLLEHVSSLLAKQSDQVLQEQFGVGMAQFKILQALQSSPRITQREIANRLGQTEASISRQVKLMLERGLLHSLRRPDDRRDHLTVVTNRGLRLVEAAEAALERYHRGVFSQLSDRHQERLLVALRDIHKSLCNESHPMSEDGRQRSIL